VSTQGDGFGGPDSESDGPGEVTPRRKPGRRSLGANRRSRNATGEPGAGSAASGWGSEGAGAGWSSKGATPGRNRARDRSSRGERDASGWGATSDGGPADPEAAAREICLRLLSFSPRTRAQLADALRRKGVADEVAEQVLGRYTEVGLIDDEAFARAWVQSRHAGRGLGRRALAAELRQRGVADDTVKEAVEELAPEQEETAARELVAKRMATTRGLDPTKRTRRILGVLARKGYPSGLAYRLVREALENEGIDDDVPFED
jgi:regulatory protein